MKRYELDFYCCGCSLVLVAIAALSLWIFAGLIG